MPTQEVKSHLLTTVVYGTALVGIGALLFAFDFHDVTMVRSAGGAIALACGAAKFSRLLA
jgi:hypothetical protein